MSRRLTLWVVCGYVVVMLLAGGLRVLTFDRFLPLLDYSDESNMFLLAQALRPEGAPLADQYGAALTLEWLAGYPPLFVWLSLWTQRLLEAVRTDFLFPGDYIGVLRALAALANTLTVGVLMWAGKSLCAPLGSGWAALAGGLAGLVWAISPQAVDVGNLAIPDSFIPLACAVTLLGGIRALRVNAPRWLLLSLAGAIAAIYLKYSLVFMLWVPLVSFIVLWRQLGTRQMLPALAGLALMGALTAGYLIWGYGALGLQNKESQSFRTQGLANLLDLDRNRVNLGVALELVGGVWLWAAALLFAFGVWLWARRVGVSSGGGRWLWMLAPLILGNSLLTSSVVYADLARGGYGRVRWMFPAALALALLWGAALSYGAQRLSAHSRRARAFAGGAVALFAALLIVPAFQPNLAQIHRYALPHTNLLLWQYTDASLPNDGLILTARGSSTHLVWNRPYSGYDGATPFAWAHDENPAESGTPQSAHAAGIRYFVVTDADRERIYNSDAMRAYFNALYPLKRLPQQPASGEPITVYRLLPPQNERYVPFGEQIALVGYDLEYDETQLWLRPYWQASETPAKNLSMFVHLYPRTQPTDIRAQWDGAPASPARLPVTWTDPEERLMGAQVSLALPADFSPEAYTLVLGLYDFTNGERLPTPQGDRFVVFGEP